MLSFTKCLSAVLSDSLFLGPGPIGSFVALTWSGLQLLVVLQGLDTFPFFPVLQHIDTFLDTVRKFISHSTEAPRLRHQHLVRACFLAYRWLSSCCVLTWQSRLPKLLKSTDQLLCRTSVHLGLSDVSLWLDSSSAFWAESYKVIYSSQCITSGGTVSSYWWSSFWSLCYLWYTHVHTYTFIIIWHM